MHSECNCKCGAVVFKIFSALVLLDIIFVTATAFVYLKDYFMHVKQTYNPETKTYEVRKEFIILYVCSSFSTSIFILYIIFVIVWLIVNFTC